MLSVLQFLFEFRVNCLGVAKGSEIFPIQRCHHLPQNDT
jgi:hypothetical protein